MEGVLELRLPWGMIRKQIYVEMKDGKVDYESCLDRYQIEAMFSKVSNTNNKNSCIMHNNSWVSRDVINFTGGQLQIDTLSSD